MSVHYGSKDPGLSLGKREAVVVVERCGPGDRRLNRVVLGVFRTQAQAMMAMQADQFLLGVHYDYENTVYPLL